MKTKVEINRFPFLFLFKKEYEIADTEKYETTNKYLIMFLKFVPLLLVIYFTARIPKDLADVYALILSICMVYLGYKLGKNKALIITVLVVQYFILLFLILNIPFFGVWVKHYVTTLIFVWATKELYFAYMHGYFDEYYYLENGWFFRIIK